MHRDTVEKAETLADLFHDARHEINQTLQR